VVIYESDSSYNYKVCLLYPLGFLPYPLGYLSPLGSCIHIRIDLVSISVHAFLLSLIWIPLVYIIDTPGIKNTFDIWLMCILGLMDMIELS
jgi:hypothetical protein